MKIIAFHLPQYHSFPENDKWWGKGFTDWDNVKKAKPLFEGHMQPVVPDKAIYYNMLEVDTLKRQAELAREYGVYAFCYYHYWFDGKLLMEKPVELLLKNSDIKTHFCMCWANEPWTRAWDGATSEVIMPQEYGSKKEWKEHIDYLIPFFKDDRYIKINGCPLFVIYRTESISDIDSMIQLWEDVCRKAGFDGIHIVEELNGFQTQEYSKKSKAVLKFQPNYEEKVRGSLVKKIDRLKSKFICQRYDVEKTLYFASYDRVWKRILKDARSETRNNIYPGAFVAWDNTPRKKTKGSVFYGATPEKFEKYFSRLACISNEKKSEFIFVNAWNEWAEGAYLEPDETTGYKYLDVIKRINEKYDK